MNSPDERKAIMHTVEKIGGTSMSRFDEVLNTIFTGQRRGSELYNRIFLVSAYGGITNLLLEQKKSGEPGVYARFADAENEDAWLEALERVRAAMLAKNAELFSAEYERHAADRFIGGRLGDAGGCIGNLCKLCSYRHLHSSMD